MRHSLDEYLTLFATLRDGPVAPAPAPRPGGAGRARSDLLSHCYFLDATLAGIAAADDGHVLVIGVETPRTPAWGTVEHRWLAGAETRVADVRAAEIAVVMAGYLRQLGHASRAHMAGATDVDLAACAVAAGLGLGDHHGLLVHPYLGTRMRLAAVTTACSLDVDRPLRRITGAMSRLRAFGPGWLLGAGGARPGWRALGGQRRALHLGRWPMERVRRVPRATTRITDAVPRVPKRAAFFARAAFGDLGNKAQVERQRFAMKTPYAQGYSAPLRAMVPLQDGRVASGRVSDCVDPSANAQAVKAAGYWLGADMVGICEVPEYAWFSHHEDGRPITPYHRYAVVMLIDQGFETMDGASGDDWISGAQSMRAYMRGAEIAGLLAAHLRRLGFGARAQTNLDSDVLHIPLVLHAGLGELSRIGELVLNPFVGPRFKSVVVTTDVPLEVDQPIDFGLLDFCEQCNKCARECPCDAIPYGGRVMFNGYEIWKPDVERCTRYRLTNRKGSACGRCMKACPYNTEGLLAHRIGLWCAMHLPFTRGTIARLDDHLGNGRRNAAKRWWYDLEIVDGVAVDPPHGTNERDLDVGRNLDPSRQRIALYPAEVMPPPGAREPVPLDRKRALGDAPRAPPTRTRADLMPEYLGTDE